MVWPLTELDVRLVVATFFILFTQIVLDKGDDEAGLLPTHFTQLECEESYYLPDFTFMKFKLDKPQKCDIAIMGSRRSLCTTEIMCPHLETANPNTKKCAKEYMKISDGVGGELRGCGNLSFNTPHKATNKGTDLYLSFKSISPNSYCQVFCAEDKKRYAQLKDKGSNEIFKAKTNVKNVEPSCVCGVKNVQEGRIVGGESAQEFEFPWIAAITYSMESRNRNISKRSPFCGASLITDRHILTAAHCFVNTGMRSEDVNILLHGHVMDLSFLKTGTSKKKIEAIPGWNLLSKTDEKEESIRLEISEVKVHPLYDKETFDFDVAILFLNTRLNLKITEKLRPVCLPPEGEFSEIDGKNIEVAGWGKIDEHGGSGRILQKVQVPVINWNKCNELYGGQVSLKHLCAGFVDKGGRDACQGDSGGPAIYKGPGNGWIQRGIVSAGIGCARPENAGFYTDIQEVIQWIYHTARKGIWCTNDN